jgi:NADH-quinone oxidoreductase subunit K
VIPTSHYVALSLLLFIIGAVGVMTRRNAIIALMSIELMFNAATINLVAFSAQLEDISGHVFGVFVIAIAAGEAAVGLAILLALFRNKQSINLDDYTIMKG